MTEEDLKLLYSLGLFRDLDEAAKAHLKFDWQLVAKAINNSPEHQVYDRAIGFLKSSGLIKFFDHDSILGRIFGRSEKK
jgi:hypothetical protein